MCFHESTWLSECRAEFKPILYRRYVDDIFLLFKTEEHVRPFFEYLNSRHRNITFTFEKECEGKISFLDVSVSREKGKFVTSVYRKPTFSGVFSSFKSFIPEKFKQGLVSTLLFRCFSISSDFSKFHLEVKTLKDIFRKNSYPMDFIDKCIRKFLNNCLVPKTRVTTVPKKEILIILLFLGKTSTQIRTKLNRLLTKSLPYCKPIFVFKPVKRLSACFPFKDKIPNYLCSGLVYHFKCRTCNSSYYGKSIRHFKVRMSEHLGISALTGKVSKTSKEPTAVQQHFLDSPSCSPPSFDDFQILTRETNDFKLTVKESLLIDRDKPVLNRTIKSMPLEIFQA